MHANDKSINLMHGMDVMTGNPDGSAKRCWLFSRSTGADRRRESAWGSPSGCRPGGS